jgi:hypothetical protein
MKNIISFILSFVTTVFTCFFKCFNFVIFTVRSDTQATSMKFFFFDSKESSMNFSDFKASFLLSESSMIFSDSKASFSSFTKSSMQDN